MGSRELDFMFEIQSGKLQRGLITLFSVVRNELYFLPAFLDHYRSLGVEQFIFIDDRSSDGTREFLNWQRDCVVVTAPMRYGDKIQGKRAGPLWKTLLPKQYLSHQWALCADADEFVILPEHVGGFPELIGELERLQANAAAAVMIDCYPAHINDLKDPHPPQNAGELMARYPYFDRGPYVDWQPGRLTPKVLNDGAITRLIKQFPTGDQTKFIRKLTQQLRSAISTRMRKRFVYKVPLVKWLPHFAYSGAHALNSAPAPNLLLPILHFKITGALFEKIDWATRSKSYARSSWKYFALNDVLMEMERTNATFLCEASVKFDSFNDLAQSGLADLRLLQAPAVFKSAPIQMPA